MLAAVSCSKENAGGLRPDSVPALCPAGEIVVSSGGKTVQTYSFEYDASSRVTKLLCKDNISGAELLNLSYVYGGECAMGISGKMFGKLEPGVITVNNTPSGITYKGAAYNGWEYSTSIGADGVATAVSCTPEFSSSAGYYSSSTGYGEVFEFSGKDIVRVEAGTKVRSKAQKPIFGSGKAFTPVSVATGSSLTTYYKYTDKKDRQNFCAFVFSCCLPVFYAAGLPGCEHLISDVSMSVGEVEMPQKQHFEYTFTEKGDIDSVTRTWSSDGKVYLTMKYEFKYKTTTE